MRDASRGERSELERSVLRQCFGSASAVIREGFGRECGGESEQPFWVPFLVLLFCARSCDSHAYSLERLSLFVCILVQGLQVQGCERVAWIAHLLALRRPVLEDAVRVGGPLGRLP